MIRESLPVTFPLILKQGSVKKNHKSGRSRGSRFGDAWVTRACREQGEVARGAERHQRSLLAKMITNEMLEGLDGGEALIVGLRCKIARELHRICVE